MRPLKHRRVEPRGLSRDESADYVGVSTSLFDQMVADGRMPSPIRINSRLVWDKWQLDEAIDKLRTSDGKNPWDDLAA
jgi:predicted DNA-binding transcriptional regulator AlpA